MTCEGCKARAEEVAFLRAQVKELQDRLVAMANPIALAVARGDMPAPTQMQTPLGTADGVDASGHPYVLVDGVQVPQEEFRRGMEMLQKQMAGG